MYHNTCRKGVILSVCVYVYCKATIFSELLNLVKLAMTHETLNLLALNVRSKVTLYSSNSIISHKALIKAPSKNNCNPSWAPSLESKKYFGHLRAPYLESRLLIRTNLL